MAFGSDIDIYIFFNIIIYLIFSGFKSEGRHNSVLTSTRIYIHIYKCSIITLVGRFISPNDHDLFSIYYIH